MMAANKIDCIMTACEAGRAPLDELIDMHERLTIGDSLSRPLGYGIDIRRYLDTSAALLDRRLIAELALAGWSGEQSATDVVQSLVRDDELIADYCAIVCQDAQALAIATMATACAEHRLGFYNVKPAVWEHLLRLGPDGRLAAQIRHVLNLALAFYKASENRGFVTLIMQVADALHAVDRVCNASAVVLASVDVEKEVAQLICNEAAAELM